MSSLHEREANPDFAVEAIPRGDIVTIDYSTALAMLKSGLCVSRVGWNGPNQWLHIQTPDGYSYMTLPYIYIRTVQGDRVPWIASQTDQLMNDWYVCEGVMGEEEDERRGCIT